MSQGFGCMGFSAFYKSAEGNTDEKSIAVLKHAVDRGVKLFNSAAFYGPLNEEGFGANLRLLNKFLASGVDRSQIQLMVKIGMDTRAPVEKTGQVWINRADSEGLKADVEFALKTLDTDYIDIIVLCRVSPTVPIEESVLAMKSIVDEGKAKFIGLSEASAETIRRAVKVAPIYCIEQEWSLWTRDIEAEILPACRENNIKIVAYSPLGRGFLTGSFESSSALDPMDFRSFGMPRFSPENIATNYRLVSAVKGFASTRNCTAGQVALAWLHAQGADVIPIPGTTSIKHLDENLGALEVVLTAEELAELDNIISSHEIAGNRYAHMAMTFHSN